MGGAVSNGCFILGFYAASAGIALGPGIVASGSYFEAGYVLGQAARYEGMIEGAVNTINKFTGFNIPTPASIVKAVIQYCSH